MDKEKLRGCSDYFRAMFSKNFQEDQSDRIELKSVELEPFRTMLDWVEAEVEDGVVESAATRELMEVLECSNMLQVTSVSNKCSDLLNARVSEENCWQILQLADLVADRRLFKTSQQFILWNFSKLYQHTNLTRLDKNNFVKLISSQFLNVGREVFVVRAITDWIEAHNPDQSVVKNIFESCLYSNGLSQADKEEVKKNKYCDPEYLMMPQTRRRRLPTVPCVVGYVYGKDDKKSVCIFGWNEREKKILVVTEIPSVQADQVVASGFKVASEGVELVLSGGEFSLGYSKTRGLLPAGFDICVCCLGYSNWNRNILGWSSLSRSWALTTTVDTVRRHHSALLQEGQLWMLGGTGKHRLVLDNVDRLDLHTGQEQSVSTLPFALNRPAVALNRRSQIVVVGQKTVAVFDTETNTWSPHTVTNYPSDVEFDRAMYDPESDSLYLTSSYSRNLFQCSLSQDPCNIQSVGKFTTETQNTCIVDGIIYNFNSEEFGDERVLESYDVRSQEFSILWKDNLPQWDFSPNYCLGCFPLVNYDFIC